MIGMEYIGELTGEDFLPRTDLRIDFVDRELHSLDSSRVHDPDDAKMRLPPCVIHHNQIATAWFGTDSGQ